MKNVIVFDFNRTLYNPEINMLMDGALEILKILSEQNNILVLLGKGCKDRKKLIDKLGISVYFKEVLLFLDKDIEQLEKLKSKFSNSTNFYSIGDRINNEILLGNQAGFKTVWLKNGKYSKEIPKNKLEKPWKVVTSLQDIRKII